MQLRFSGALWYWRGPAPWYFVTVPDEQCEDLQALSGLVSYGWGMIPVTATIGTAELLPPGIRSRFVANVNGLRMHILEAGDETDGRPHFGFPRTLRGGLAVS